MKHYIPPLVALSNVLCWSLYSSGIPAIIFLSRYFPGAKLLRCLEKFIRLVKTAIDHEYGWVKRHTDKDKTNRENLRVTLWQQEYSYVN